MISTRKTGQSAIQCWIHIIIWCRGPIIDLMTSICPWGRWSRMKLYPYWPPNYPLRHWGWKNRQRKKSPQQMNQEAGIFEEAAFPMLGGDDDPKETTIIPLCNQGMRHYQTKTTIRLQKKTRLLVELRNCPRTKEIRFSRSTSGIPK